MPVDKLLDVENVYLTQYKIRQAQKYARKYRPNKTPPPVLRKEYKVILPSTMDHFEKWIFSPGLTEQVKMREKHIAAGHVLARKQPRYSSFPRYKADCEEKGLVPLPREIYMQLLGMKGFIDLKQDDCMCPKCMAYGWRGIEQKKKDFFNTLRKLGKSSGCFTVDTDPVKLLSERLEAAWNHMRTTYSQHLKEQDEIASHCLRRQLGHSCNSHLDSCCDHTRSDVPQKDFPLEWKDVPQTEGNRSLGGHWNSRCEVCDIDCKTGGGRTVSSMSRKCRYCCHTCCNDCFKTYFPAEGTDANFLEKQEYICNKCSAEIDLLRHQPGGCASCDDLEHLPVDIMNAVTRVERFAGDHDTTLTPNPVSGY